MIFILCYTGNNHAENYSIRNIAIYYKLLFLLDESGPGENIDHKSHEALLVCCCKRSNTTASFSLCHWQMISRRKIRKQTRIETNESRKHSTFARLILKPRCLYSLPQVLKNSRGYISFSGASENETCAYVWTTLHTITNTLKYIRTHNSNSHNLWKILTKI